MLISVNMIHEFEQVWALVRHKDMCDQSVHSVYVLVTIWTRKSDMVVIFHVVFAYNIVGRCEYLTIFSGLVAQNKGSTRILLMYSNMFIRQFETKYSAQP